MGKFVKVTYLLASLAISKTISVFPIYPAEQCLDFSWQHLLLLTDFALPRASILHLDLASRREEIAAWTSMIFASQFRKRILQSNPSPLSKFVRFSLVLDNYYISYIGQCFYVNILETFCEINIIKLFVCINILKYFFLNKYYI